MPNTCSRHGFPLLLLDNVCFTALVIACEFPTTVNCRHFAPNQIAKMAQELALFFSDIALLYPQSRTGNRFGRNRETEHKFGSRAGNRIERPPQTSPLP
jgi:hypothetical protein